LAEITADRDKWQKRAQAYENAVKLNAFNLDEYIICKLCKSSDRNRRLADRKCDICVDEKDGSDLHGYEFDEERFASSEPIGGG